MGKPVERQNARPATSERARAYWCETIVVRRTIDHPRPPSARRVVSGRSRSRNHAAAPRRVRASQPPLIVEDVTPVSTKHYPIPTGWEGKPSNRQTSRSPPLSALCETPHFRIHTAPPYTRKQPHHPHLSEPLRLAASRHPKPDIANTKNQKRPRSTPAPAEKKKEKEARNRNKNKLPTSQALHGLVWPFLRYLDLEFAHAEFEVD